MIGGEKERRIEGRGEEEERNRRKTSRYIMIRVMRKREEEKEKSPHDKTVKWGTRFLVDPRLYRVGLGRSTC